jgi:hypothetical protein
MLPEERQSPDTIGMKAEVVPGACEVTVARRNGDNVVRRFVVLLAFWAILTLTSAYATVDDAISRALEAFDPYVKQGYVLHWDDQWGGDLGVKDRKAIPQTLFRGNDYWFCMGTDVDKARVTVHVYDSNGKLADSDAWQKGWSAAARTLILTTGRYYVIVEVTNSPVERTHWAMVYGSKRIGLQNADSGGCRHSPQLRRVGFDAD